MILLIDAYNVLKQIEAVKNIDDSARNKFIKQLVVYSQKKNLKAVLVFDGGLCSSLYKEKRKNVYIVYVGYGHTADDYIKNYINVKKNKNILLVTYDNELKSFAAYNNIDTIGSYEFYDIMIASLQVKNEDQSIKLKTTIKTTESSNDELDKLMEEAQVEYKSEDFINKNGLQLDSSGKLSKKERRIINKIKKL